MKSVFSTPSTSSDENEATPPRLFTVTSGRYAFPASLVHTREGLIRLHFAVPARRKTQPCMIFTVDRSDLSAVEMSDMHYDAACGQGLEKDLQCGRSRRSPSADMVRVGCVAARRLLAPAAEAVVFTDESGFPCGEIELQLAPHSILLYGRTWYQRVLPCATPERPEARHELASRAARLSEAVPKLDEFWSIAIGDLRSLPPALLPLERRRQVRDAYNRAVARHGVGVCSWNDVFRAINMDVGCDVFHHIIKRMGPWWLGMAWRVSYDGSGGDLEHRVAEVGLERWVEETVGEVRIQELSTEQVGGSVGRNARRAVQRGLEARTIIEAERGARRLAVHGLQRATTYQGQVIDRIRGQFT